MNSLRSYILTIIICLYYSNSIFGMVFDNRYFPLFLKPYIQRNSPHAHYQIQPFFMRAERGNGDLEKTRLPDIDGIYDELDVFESLVSLKPRYRNLLKSDLQGQSIAWRRNGRLDAQGIAFYYEQFLHNYFSIGTSFLFLHYNSRHEFLLNKTSFEQNHKEDLYYSKQKIHNALCVEPALDSKIGFGDIDLFLKLNYTWKYCWKIRSIDTRLKLGTYIPTASKIDINNPASLPIGGNKHWGVYADFELNTEIKEDWWASVMLRGIKRFKRTDIARMPINQEPSKYGALIGPLETDPGWTLVFNPYATFAGLRDGFGLQILYTLVHHWPDQLRSNYSKVVRGNNISPQLGPVSDRSGWRSEYVTASAFYDFAIAKDCDRLPTVSLYWDIPVDFLEARRSYKTNSISIMVQGNF